MRDEPRSITSMMEEMDRSSGGRVVREINNLRRTHRLFLVNHQELKTAIAEYRDPERFLDFWAMDNRSFLEGFMGELGRRLHNYLASVATLIDHTRVLLQRLYQGRDFEREYNKKKSEVIETSELAAFVKDLRNYAVHVGLPVTAANMSINMDSGVDSRILLNVKSMSEWSGFKSKSKSYIAGKGESVDLEEVIDQYNDLIAGFYDWFYKRQLEVHRDELIALEELKEKCREVMRSRGFSVDSLTSN